MNKLQVTSVQQWRKRAGGYLVPGIQQVIAAILVALTILGMVVWPILFRIGAGVSKLVVTGYGAVKRTLKGLWSGFSLVTLVTNMKKELLFFGVFALLVAFAFTGIDFTLLAAEFTWLKPVLPVLQNLTQPQVLTKFWVKVIAGTTGVLFIILGLLGYGQKSSSK